VVIIDSVLSSQVALYVKQLQLDAPDVFSLDAFLSAVNSRLIKSEVFCDNKPWSLNSLMRQKTTYNYNLYLSRHCLRGGHTYMTSKQRNRFVRINPENMNSTVLRVSVRSERGTLPDDKELVWECILLVTEWWWKKNEGSESVQARLNAKSLRVVPGYTFVVTGGPLFHLLVALCFARECKRRNLGSADLAFETYGTKQLRSPQLAQPDRAPSDADLDALCQDLSDHLKWDAPFQLQRLHSFFDNSDEGGAGISLGWTASKVTLTWGIGCSIRTRDTSSKAAPLIPVVSCVPCPWTSRHDTGPPTYFSDRIRRKGGKEFQSYIPLEHKSRVLTYNIYNNVFPTSMQPTTLMERRGSTTLQMQIPLRAGSVFRSERLSRVQQYNNNARLAVGESGLQEKTSAKLGAAPAQENPHTHTLTIDLLASRTKVDTFVQYVTNHFSDIQSDGGGHARVEIAVPHTGTFKESLRSAVHDAVLIAQQHTHSYDADTWGAISRFYSLGLQSRINCAIAAMEPLRLTASVTAEVERRDEVAEVTAEVFGSIKTFYSGKGILEDSTRTLPRTAYALQRPILCKLREHLGYQRTLVLRKKGGEWLDHFYAGLGASTADIHRSIPDFVSMQKDYLARTMVPGRACPHCWAIFSEQDKPSFRRHLCTRQLEKSDWIRLTSVAFRRHHEAVVDALTVHQRLLLTMLDDSYQRHIYLSGLAGTGKSTAVRAAAEDLCMRSGVLSYVLLAPTNIAATQIGGCTINSFVGCTIDDLWDAGTNNAKWNGLVSRFLRECADRAEQLRAHLRYVFLDEVGMVTASELSFLDYFLCRIMGHRTVDRDVSRTFGGVKVVLVGDPLQVPPVSLRVGKGFFFQSPTFCSTESRFAVLYLKTVLRSSFADFVQWQSVSRLGGDFMDDSDLDYAEASFGAFVSRACEERTAAERQDLFDAIQNGKHPNTSKAFLDGKKQRFYTFGSGKETNNRFDCSLPRKRAAPPHEMCADTIHPPAYIICLEKEERHHYQTSYEGAFDVAERKTVDAVDQWPASINTKKLRGQYAGRFQLPTEVVLAVGMRVGFLWNKVAHSVGRNTLGIVTELGADYIDVRLTSGHTVRVVTIRETIEFVHKSSSLSATRVQYPVQCCAAGTTYTVQGQTLTDTPCLYDNTRIHPRSYGAAYTACSRFADPAFFRACHRLCKDDFIAHPDAIRFDQFHFQQTAVITHVTYSYHAIEDKSSRSGGNPEYHVSPACRGLADHSCMLCCPMAEVQARTKEVFRRHVFSRPAESVSMDDVYATAADVENDIEPSEYDQVHDSRADWGETLHIGGVDDGGWGDWCTYQHPAKRKRRPTTSRERSVQMPLQPHNGGEQSDGDDFNSEFGDGEDEECSEYDDGSAGSEDEDSVDEKDTPTRKSTIAQRAPVERQVRCIGVLVRPPEPLPRPAGFVRVEKDEDGLWLVEGARNLRQDFDRQAPALRQRYADMACSLAAAEPAETLLPLTKPPQCLHHLWHSNERYKEMVINEKSLWKRAVGGRKRSGVLNSNLIGHRVEIPTDIPQHYQELFVCASGRVFVFDDEDYYPSYFASNIVASY
jgi:hypothetical protein